VASVHCFQAFAWQYELAHNDLLEPKLKRALDLDFHQPIPWAYGALAIVVLCYRAWKRRKGISARPQQRKCVMPENSVAAALVVSVTLACFVWPTPWQYGVFPDKKISLSQQALSSPNPLSVFSDIDSASDYQTITVENSRRNRATGEIELRIKGHWYSYPDYCQCSSSR
jgi:hypothetical protein